MADDTDALFDLDATHPDAPDAPRCRLCVRPARFNRVREVYTAYCGGAHCDNQSRLCQVCGAEFVMNIDGAGTKYCSTECKRQGYTVGYGGKAKPVCAWCGAAGANGSGKGKVWPFVCRRCFYPLRYVETRLRSHRVPIERVKQLLDDPGCEICGINIIEGRKDSQAGKMKAQLVVDHDHGCCPVGKHSCGACVRGLLCHGCNSAAGLLRDDAEAAQQLAFYLARATGHR